MNKEQQDRLWTELSEESKEEYRKVYKTCIDQMNQPNRTGLTSSSRVKAEAEYTMLYGIFGEHNLNPKPPTPKTWEDVEKKGYKIFDDYRGEDITDLHSDYRELGNYCDCICLQGFNYDLDRKRPDNKIILKAIATLKIAKLIELGYGGCISEEEWEDEFIEKFVVKWCASDNHPFYDCETRHNIFIAFHTPEQREKFMSYESNRKLVEQYYMM